MTNIHHSKTIPYPLSNSIILKNKEQKKCRISLCIFTYYFFIFFSLVLISQETQKKELSERTEKKKSCKRLMAFLLDANLCIHLFCHISSFLRFARFLSMYMLIVLLTQFVVVSSLYYFFGFVFSSSMSSLSSSLAYIYTLLSHCILLIIFAEA